MKKEIKEELVEKFDNENEVKEFKGDFDALTKKKKRKKLIITLSLSIPLGAIIISTGIIASYVLFENLEYEDSVKKDNLYYSKLDYEIASYNSYTQLNNIEYPNGEKVDIDVNSEYVDAITSFSNKIYYELLKESKDVGFAPFSLYQNLELVSNCSTNEDVNSELDTLLGLTKEKRNTYFVDAYLNDFFNIEDSGILEMYNGAFISSKYGVVNEELVNTLTKRYTECFALDFNDDYAVDQMFEWAQFRSRSYDLFNRQSDFNEALKDSIAAYLISTMYLDASWKEVFLDVNSYKDNFYLEDGSIMENVEYMSHSYFGDYYDYDDYVSFRDKYSYGTGLYIKYIVPKSHESSIYDLLENKNIFIDEEIPTLDDEGNQKYDEYGYALTNHYKSAYIKLSVPKINVKTSNSFDKILQNLGCTTMFDNKVNSFSYLYSSLNEGYEDSSFTLTKCNQKNMFSLDENGTTIKTVTYSTIMDATSADFYGNSLTVKINQPAIYIVYDSNDIPLYCGTLNSPQK